MSAPTYTYLTPSNVLLSTAGVRDADMREVVSCANNPGLG